MIMDKWTQRKEYFMCGDGCDEFDVLLQVGMLAPLDACQAWQIDHDDVEYEHGMVVWRGTSQELKDTGANINAGYQASGLTGAD